MDNDTFFALVSLLHYVATDEEKDWEESGKPANHIYLDVLKLKAWVAERGE